MTGRWDFSGVSDASDKVPYDAFFYPDALNPRDMTTRVLDAYDLWIAQYSHRACAVHKLLLYLKK